MLNPLRADDLIIAATAVSAHPAGAGLSIYYHAGLSYRHMRYAIWPLIIVSAAPAIRHHQVAIRQVENFRWQCDTLPHRRSVARHIMTARLNC